MAALIQKFEPKVLVETVIWVFRKYINHGFYVDYWYFQIKNWDEILKLHLTKKHIQK